MATPMFSLKELMMDLLNANPNLTGSQARDYAARIIMAEEREDYVRMHILIQEALFGPDRHKTAA